MSYLIRQSEKTYYFNTRYYDNFLHFKSDYGGRIYYFSFLVPILKCFILSVHFEFQIG